jgi:hypothetical protein
VHLFRPRLSFLAEAQPRLENRHFLAEVYIKFFRRPHRTNYKEKNIIGKIKNLFCIFFYSMYLFLLLTKLEIYYLQYK